jgi:uncharacterized membrane protein YkvA (DUF1232 family)
MHLWKCSLGLTFDLYRNVRRGDETMWKRLALLWTVVRGDARLLWRALKHPHSPRWLKPAAVALVAYLFWPVDLISDLIPVLGLVDDIVLIPLAIRFLLDRLPPAVRTDIASGTVGA